MTDGTSQGLFIVVAIVIFGIFTLMAYILFEDTLSPALASMFTDGIEKTTKDIDKQKNEVSRIHDEFIPSSAIRINPENKEGVFQLKWDEKPVGGWGEGTPIGLQAKEHIKLAWGEKITVSFDVISPMDSQLVVDYNAKPLNINNHNDYYGDRNTNSGAVHYNLKANEKKTLSYFLVNNNVTVNPEHLDLYEHSTFGLHQKYLTSGEVYEISNIRYQISKP